MLGAYFQYVALKVNALLLEEKQFVLATISFQLCKLGLQLLDLRCVADQRLLMPIDCTLNPLLNLFPLPNLLLKLEGNFPLLFKIVFAFTLFLFQHFNCVIDIF